MVYLEILPYVFLQKYLLSAPNESVISLAIENTVAMSTTHLLPLLILFQF